MFPNWTRIADALRGHGVDAPPARLAAAEPHAKLRLDVKEQVKHSNDAERGWLYFNLVLEHAGIARSPATDAALQELHAYHAEHNLWELVPEDVVPALQALRTRVRRMVVVSNSNGRLHQKLARLGLGAFFDVILDSAVEGIEKPDPRFFEIALARAGAQRDTTLHVGDFYWIDVVGARSAGLQAALLDAADLYPEVDCTRLRRLGDLLPLVGRSRDP